MEKERQAKFTPGPWMYDGDTGFVSPLTGGESVCDVWTFDCREVDGNGHLIAAAPEMYEALEEAYYYVAALGDHYFYTGVKHDFAEKIEKILKKARGEE